MNKLKESTKGRKIYGNYLFYSPDDILMFRSDLKKANWYIERGLAEWISETSIKLKFEPNGLGLHNKSYGLHSMENICVVCGSDQYLTKHHVVPKCYRIHFSDEYKTHKFHDVLALCHDCHYTYEKVAFEYKKEIGEIYGYPIVALAKEMSGLNRNVLKLKGLIKCLTNPSIPESRIKEIESKIKEDLNIDEVTPDVIESIDRLEDNIAPSQNGHGKGVVDQIKDIQKFQSDWRYHFINNMNPRFLPKNWDIHHV